MDVRTQMRRSARYFENREAVVFRDRRLTFGDAWTRGIRMANALLALGIKPGERVGVLEDNSFESSDFFLGAAIANIVRVPLYPRNSRESHGYMLGHTNCRAFLVAEKYLHEVDGIDAELEDLSHIIVRDASYEDWLGGHAAVDPDVAIEPDDLYLIRHTGGTTGLPKGIAFTHQSWIATVRDWFYGLPPVEPGDTCLHIGPISHASGYLFVPIWLSGGCNILLDRFDLDETIETIAREKIGYMFMAPTMVNAVSRYPKIREKNFSSLKSVMIGSAPIADETAVAAHEILGRAAYQTYGQSESGMVALMGPNQWFAEVEGSTPLRACGMAMPFTEVEIRDEDNNVLPHGETGQIATKSDGQMTEYWNSPEETAERLVDGWILSGDIGMLDRNGYIYMFDRSDDVIISGGFNIWPAELENVISDHPAVIEVAVFGIPSERWGETPMAVCTVAESSSAIEREIVDLCVARLGSYKKPGQIRLTTDPLPKSVAGKIMRKTLREPYWEGQARRVAGS